MRNRALRLALAVLPVVLSSTTGFAYARALTIETRIQAQRAIEEVYWRHRTWPEANRDPKPELSAVMSPSALRSRVEDYIRKSNALAADWGRPITSMQLQAEMERMARESKSPAVLAELFAALGNDPGLIAETLVRQKLVERLIRDAYAHDNRLGALSFDAWWSTVQEKQGMSLFEVVGTYNIVRPSGSGCVDDTWSNTFDAGAGVPSARYDHTAVWTGAEMIVWGGSNGLNTGARYDPSTDSWVATSTGAGVPWARFNHTAVWTGTEMIVWGGYVNNGGVVFPSNTGGRYNPSADMWVATPLGSGCPSSRSDHTAVWTGTEMVVWGGGYQNTGGRYNPSTNTWEATSEGTDVPQGRSLHSAVWTGTRMIVFGGLADAFTALETGGRYDPSTDTWEPMSNGVGVGVRFSHTAVWTGTEMIVWGGNSSTNSGARYDPESQNWTLTTGTGVPTGGHTAVWTGTEMIVWGGQEIGGSRLNTGGRYHPPTGTWVAMSTGAGVPTARRNHTAVWTGREMIVWGGSAATSTGGRYCASARCTGSPAICDDGGACTSTTCDLGTGLCVNTNTPKPDGTPCSDGVTCTDGETCTAGACGGGTPSTPGELQHLRFVDGTKLVWDAISDSPRYDVLRGDLSALPVGPGSGDEFCFDELPTASFDDGTPVSPGTGFWYVTRGSNVCGVGSYGTQRDETPRTSTTCP